MQVTYTLTADDFHHARIAYRNRNFFSRWTNLFLALLLVLWAAVQGYLHFAGLSQPWLRWSFPLTLFGIWILLYFYWILPRNSAWRQFSNTPSAREKITLTLQEGGLHFLSETSNGAASWKRYIKWLENEYVFVLFVTPGMFISIPKRAFGPDDLALFGEALRQNIPA
jgi:hypothetical protein